MSGFFDTSGTGTFYGKWLITTSGDGFSGIIIGKSKSTFDSSNFEIKELSLGLEKEFIVWIKSKVRFQAVPTMEA